MKKRKSLYHGHRFPAAIIGLAVRWYFRFQLGLRDIEELLFERCRCQLRDDPPLVQQIRRGLRTSRQSCSPQAWPHMASGRSLRGTGANIANEWVRVVGTKRTDEAR
ncbi:hypothetical protein QFZ97_006840 [Paraburkholderia youngii]